MAVFTRSKRITFPLDDRVRARLRGEFAAGASSGSDHDPDSSSSLSALLNSSLDSEPDTDSDPGTDTDSAARSPAHLPTNFVANTLRELLSPPASADPLRARLASDVDSAAEAAAASGLTGPACRRAVMVGLRERGYNAGICKARWEGGGGLTAGSYEYIDVVWPPGSEGTRRRHIVDMGFAAEFEVARGTEEYGRVVGELPEVAVASAEEVRSAVRIMAEELRRSLKSRGMSVPPWRKKRYMMAKWFGFYRRTVNAAGVGATKGAVGEVTWRAVGFGCAG